MTSESPPPPDPPENPHDDELDVEGPNESIPNSPSANPQEQDAAADAG
jgi:hypothetical protein